MPYSFWQKGMDARRGIAAVGLLLIAAACADRPAPTAELRSRADDAVARERGIVPGEYIIVFRDGVQDVPGLARQLVARSGGELGFVYQHAVRGFSARIPAAGLDGLRRNPLIALIEPDQVVTIAATQFSATWGLDRIDQRDLPLNGTYVYNADGSGVRSYIIDTGIRNSHTDFGGRASSGYTAINDGRGTDDCNGHGTHVAGTVGGTTWGVAKNTSLVAVRVLNCQGSGTTSGVIAGVDWVTANSVKPAVANMSLGGSVSSTLDNAVNNAVATGVTFVVAAGNNNANACNYSPARAASAITVGATTSSDARASYSNFGTCLDIFAPGSAITSAWYTSNTATNTINGTSMASPHVAGAAALYLQRNQTASPSAVTSALTGNATAGKVTSAGTGSPNRLLYTGFIGGGGGQATCLEASCEPVTAVYISHFTEPNCTGTESYYTPYGGYDGVRRSWDGGGIVGTQLRTVTNTSFKMNDNLGDGTGCRVNEWPSGNTLSEFVTVYRVTCGEASCVALGGSLISHFTNANCTGQESYYTLYNNSDGIRRSWDASGIAGTILRTVTNKSWKTADSGGDGTGCRVNAWPSGNTLSDFVSIYR